MNTHSILVPLDGSPAGEYALPAAIGVARARNATLLLAYVVAAQASAADRERSLDYLNSVAQRLHGTADISIETTVLEDIDHSKHHGQVGVVASPRRSIAHVLAAAAEQPNVGLVVMTTHGRSGLSRVWLGSVTEHLLHHAPEPILLVQPKDSAPNLNTSIGFQRILIPLDGSKVAEQMLAQAIRFGKAWNAQYILLHVIDFHFEETLGGLTPLPISQSDIDAMVEQGRAYLEQIAQPLREQGLQIVTEVIIGTPPAAAIVSYATERKADLIALKTHGLSGITQLVIGSTADKVLRSAHVPVLLHRPTN